jgi:hypothetical protein
MSSENWVDVSNFLGLKKGEMTDFDYQLVNPSGNAINANDERYALAA